MTHYASRELFRRLRTAAKGSGIRVRGLYPKLAVRWGRTTRTIYAYAVGALLLPPVLWDDLADILKVMRVKVEGRATDGQRPSETPRQFVTRLRQENGALNRGRVGWRDRIVIEPGVNAGRPIIKGTRLAVEFVLELLADEWTEQKILENYPRLRHEDITAVLSYAAHVLKKETARHRGRGTEEVQLKQLVIPEMQR